MLLVLSNRWMQQQPPASMGRFNAVPNAAATSRISKRLPRGGSRPRELGVTRLERNALPCHGFRQGTSGEGACHCSQANASAAG